jgi:hypothetical protein
LVEISGSASILSLSGGTLTSGSTHVGSGTLLSGNGTINGALTNDGLITVNGGTLSLTGTVINSGTMRLTGGALLSATTSAFINGNNGVLDIMTGSQTLPANFTNNGTVIDSRAVKVRQTSVSGGDVTITIQSYSGHNYQLQRADALGTPTAWIPIGSAQAGNDGVLIFTDAGGVTGGTGRFYRIVVSP